MITKRGQGSWGLVEVEEATVTTTQERREGNNVTFTGKNADLVFGR